MGCTIRIASENAQLALPEINLGQIPGSGGTQRLYRFVGLGWAMQMVLTGQRVGAQTAKEIGLVTEVLPLADLMPRAKELARAMGAQSPIAFVAGRDAVLRSTETELLAGIDYERKLYAICMATEDSREALKAYTEKRAPDTRAANPGTKHEAILAGQRKNRSLSRRRILDARDDGGSLRRLCARVPRENRLP